MKKLLPLVALLATAAISLPVMAEPAADATHKEATKSAKAEGKKAHHGKHHGKKAAAKHGKHHVKAEAAPAPVAAPVEAAPVERKFMPSMRRGFQK